MAKLAIISSYNEECGAAFYSSRLKQHLEKIGNHEVDVLQLNVGLLRATDKESAIAAHQFVKDLAKKMKDYDGICMQFEPGLYAKKLSVAYERILILLAGHKNIVITVHGFYRGDLEGGWISFIRDVLKRKRRLRGVARVVYENYNAKKTKQFWHKIAHQLSHLKVLTFCAADKAFIKQYFHVKHIDDFPITYYTQEEVAHYRNTVPRDAMLKKYNLDPAKKYIGIFGFINRYKGHLVALKMMEFLPDDYELLVIGGEHPQGLESGASIGINMQPLMFFLDPINRPALEALTKKNWELEQDIEFFHYLKDTNIHQRVHFVGQPSDEEMVKFYTIIDYVVMPYIKTRTGQSGSGPAVFAVEFGCNTIFSNAPVFRELERYYKNGMMFSNIGNYIEFASSIQKYPHFEKEISDARDQALQSYNPATMVKKYEELLGL